MRSCDKTNLASVREHFCVYGSKVPFIINANDPRALIPVTVLWRMGAVATEIDTAQQPPLLTA